MSIIFDVCNEGTRVNSEPSGVVTSGEVVKHFERVASSEEIQDFYEVVDFSRVEDFVLTYSDFSDLSELSQHWNKKGHRFTLFYAPNKLTLDIARFITPMLQQMNILTHICEVDSDINVYIDRLLKNNI